MWQRLTGVRDPLTSAADCVNRRGRGSAGKCPGSGRAGSRWSLGPETQSGGDQERRDRNAVELEVRNGRVGIPGAFQIDAPEGSNGHALAFFRPEDVKVARSKDAPGLEARVELKIFLGATTRLHMVGEADGRPISIFGDLPSRQARLIEEGETVRVDIDPDHVQVFPA